MPGRRPPRDSRVRGPPVGSDRGAMVARARSAWPTAASYSAPSARISRATSFSRPMASCSACLRSSRERRICPSCAAPSASTRATEVPRRGPPAASPRCRHGHTIRAEERQHVLGRVQRERIKVPNSHRRAHASPRHFKTHACRPNARRQVDRGSTGRSRGRSPEPSAHALLGVGNRNVVVRKIRRPSASTLVNF